MERPSWWTYPTQCENAHEWGLGRVTIGWTSYMCAERKPSAGHIRVYCREPVSALLFSSVRRIAPWDQLWTVSLPSRGKAVNEGRWRSSEVCTGHIRSLPYGAVAALCCCTTPDWGRASRPIGRRSAACGDRQRNRSVMNSNYPLIVANSPGGDTL
jgi:hypothetical protein